jgi:hypothetical protein
MYTTHGNFIPGTRLGHNPPLRPARCGGIRQCPDCWQEAAVVTGLDYYREETYNTNTRLTVINSLLLAGVDEEMARTAVAVIENNGILFRERKVQQ